MKAVQRIVHCQTLKSESCATALESSEKQCLFFLQSTSNDASDWSRLPVDSLLCEARLNFLTRKSYLTRNGKVRGIKEELMSEYQYVGFRAIEKPVTEKNLEYMHSQSSRAEITPWSFDNEYHFGDIR